MERIFLWHFISWIQYKNILLLAGFARLPFGSSANGLVFDDFFSTPRPKLHFMERRRDDSHGKKTYIPVLEELKRLPSKFPDLWSDLSSMRSRLCLPRLSTKVRTPAAAPSCSPARLCAVSSRTSPQCSAGIEPRYISCSRAKPPGEAGLTARCLIRQGNQGAELQAHAGLTHFTILSQLWENHSLYHNNSWSVILHPQVIFFFSL